MKDTLYVFSSSVLRKKNNSLLVETISSPPNEEEETPDNKNEEILLGADIEIPKGEKKIFPIEKIDSVFAFGQVRFNTPFLSMLSDYRIPMHIFNFYGTYKGSYLPVKDTCAGSLLNKQVCNYNDIHKRLFLARSFVYGSAGNMLANIAYYKNRGTEINAEFEAITELVELIDKVENIEELLGIEGTIKKVYFNAWRKIVKGKFSFTRRVRNPPPDPVNALISYGNMIVYSFCLNEIYHTRLYPEIGWLHTTGDNKLPLCYDLAEIFKPIITDRAIFKLINKNMITENDFTIKNGSCLIKKPARKMFVKELDNRIATVISNRENDRNMSYRRIIRAECHKLINHLEGEELYTPYKSRW